jgi:hypothetical protein
MALITLFIFFVFSAKLIMLIVMLKHLVTCGIQGDKEIDRLRKPKEGGVA